MTRIKYIHHTSHGSVGITPKCLKICRVVFFSLVLKATLQSAMQKKDPPKGKGRFH